jgi:hypothetical protein
MIVTTLHIHPSKTYLMDLNDVKGLKFYIIYCLLLIAFFVYSGMIGWKWFNPTQTEPTKPNGTHRAGYIYRYHK